MSRMIEYYRLSVYQKIIRRPKGESSGQPVAPQEKRCERMNTNRSIYFSQNAFFIRHS